MNRYDKLVTAHNHGIVYPYETMRAAEDAGIYFHILCAYLEQETAGGHNVFGHDPTIFTGAGTVTKKKYLDYKKQRDKDKHHRRMQGVGPMQLTWWEFQDRADAAGGCWNPRYNILVGAQILAEKHKRTGSWDKVAREWNTNAHYWPEIAAKIEKWKKWLT